MSRLSNIVAASEALAALTPEDRALAIEAGATRRRRKGAKPGPKPGSKKTAPAPAKKSKKVSPEAKAEKAKRLISEGS